MLSRWFLLPRGRTWSSTIIEAAVYNSPYQRRCLARALDDEDRRKLHERLLAVESILKEDPEHKIGKRTGVQQMQQTLRAEAPSNIRRRRINNRVASAKLYSLVYERHALRNGYWTLKSMNSKALTKSFLNTESARVSIGTREAKLILKELYRYGKSPCLTQFQTQHEEYLRRRRENEENRLRRLNNSTSVTTNSEKPKE
jgi:hypothetical protein